MDFIGKEIDMIESMWGRAHEDEDEEKAKLKIRASPLDGDFNFVEV